MTEPREVVFTLAHARSLTVLESARALALAGVRQHDAKRLLLVFGSRGGSPDELLAAAELLYALAYQYARRTEPGLSWEEAQGWRVILDLKSGVDELAEAEAVASVDAALTTGLPPSEAGDLSLSQIEEYRRIAAEREKRSRRGRRAG